MKIGIAIDTWKLTIFEDALKAAGFTWERKPGVTEDTLLLTVEAPSADPLFALVKKANAEAAVVKEQLQRMMDSMRRKPDDGSKTDIDDDMVN